MDFYGTQYPPPQLLEKWRPIHDICVERTGVSEGICEMERRFESILPFALEHNVRSDFFVNEFIRNIALSFSLRTSLSICSPGVYLYNVCILQMPLNDLVMGTKSLKKTT